MSREWLEFFRFVVSSSMADWGARLAAACKNPQQWIVQEISSGYSASASDVLTQKIVSHVNHVFQGTIPLVFEAVNNVRVSQQKCMHHVTTFGLHKFFDEIKMTTSVKSYNPMRVNFLYFLAGSGWTVSASHYSLTPFDDASRASPGDVFVRRFSVPNDTYINLDRFLLPYQVIKLATDMNDEDDYLGFECNADNGIVSTNMHFSAASPAWWKIQFFFAMVKVSDTGFLDIDFEIGSVISRIQVHIAPILEDCPYHCVRIGYNVKSVYLNLLPRIDIEAWLYMCLGIQWWADVVNAVAGRFYPDPVLSRLAATQLFPYDGGDGETITMSVDDIRISNDV
jgi:hypothetical protein